ncbi:MAG: hypothetical protein ABIV11_06605 [Gemmatimonadaceae bacterium]
MRFPLSLAFSAVLAIGVAACGRLTGPGRGMEFTVGKAEVNATGDRALASSADGAVVVEGHITAPDPCQDIRGESTNVAGELTISVIARSKDVGCAQVIGVFPYRAVVRDLVAGSYRVRVLYRYENTGWPVKAVLDTVVTVR